MYKIIITLTTCILFVLNSYGQFPEGFKYQAIVRDAANNVLVNKSVGMQISIFQTAPNGNMVYQETFTPTSNDIGLLNLEIGTGVVQNGNFTLIDWSNGPYFLELAMDIEGGIDYSIIGTSQLMSVPYALHAKTVEIDNVQDSDSDPLNEIQNLFYEGTVLSIENGNSVDISSSSIWNSNGNKIYYNTGNVGIGTSNPQNKLTLFGTTYGSAGRTFLELRNNASDNFSNVNIRLYAGNGESFTSISHNGENYSATPGYDQSGQIWTNGNALVLRNSGSGIIRFETHTSMNTIERMRINDVGNVGIGTTNPIAKLQIANGDIFIEDASFGVIMKSPDGQCWRMTVDNSGSPMFTSVSCP